MMFTSKCFQCCNSGFNCNANWHPSSEADWSFNDIRGHRYDEVNDRLAMRPDVLKGTGAGQINDSALNTNAPADRGDFYWVLTDPTRTISGRK